MKKLMYIVAIAASVAFAACKKDKTTPEEENIPTADSTGISGTKTITAGRYFGTWAKGSVITLNGDGAIKIPEGKTLTIEEGVTIKFTSESNEIIVLGSLYSKGVAGNMVKFTVDDARKPAPSVDFKRLWGGIICGSQVKDILLLYTQIEYNGATITDAFDSYQLGLYKNTLGEKDPAMYIKHPGVSNVVIKNCIFKNIGEDLFYSEGANIIFDHNLIYTQGELNGDAINLKSGNIADVAYNLVYNPNQNAMKWSNGGGSSPQTNAYGYNNTIVNCGARYPGVKGGGIWAEAGGITHFFNNMYVNSNWGLKFKSDVDPAAEADYTWYYGNDATSVKNFQAGAMPEIKTGAHDVTSATVGANDPQFVNYPLSTDRTNATFNTSWDFRLKSTSPALTAGTTGFTPHYVSKGLTIDGVEYKSPAPSAYIGAFGSN